MVTQTLVDPPAIQYILPARIKHQDKDDVVVVRAWSVDVMQVDENENYEFRSMLPRIMMDSPIRAARIYGSSEGSTVLTESKDEMRMDWDIDDSKASSTLAPHTIVLALESKKLCFLFFSVDASGTVKSYRAYKELYSGTSVQEKLGEHVAIDPTSCALAVAAHDNLFMFMAFKSRQALFDAFQNDQDMNPIREEIMIPVDGNIVKMEFLHAPPPDTQHVILLLLVHKHEKTRILCYEWDPLSPSVRTIRQVASGQTLRPEEQFPLLLVPLRFAAAFMLVSECEYSVYRDILTGNASSSGQVLDYAEGPEEPGLSPRFPVFTQWTRPKRSLTHALEEDNIYLCREDGVVRFLEIRDRKVPGQMVGTQSKVGRLKAHINTAFASLDLNHRYDHIAAGGDMSSGGLWELRARESPERKSTIDNWTPMSDLVLVRNSSPVRDSRLGTSIIGFGSDRVFAYTGRGSSHGAITEIRYGIRATYLSGTELPESGSTPSDMWVINDDGDSGCKFVFISYPTHTAQFAIDHDDDQNLELLGFSSDVSTLAVGMLSGGLIAQVTERSIHLVSVRERAKPGLHKVSGSLFVTASFLDRVGERLIATAARQDDDIIISVQHVAHGASETPLLCDHMPSKRFAHLEVTGLILFEHCSQLALAMTTSDCKLRIFSAHGTIEEVASHDFSQDPEEDFASICDSVTVVDASSENNSHRWILCGLRNGHATALLLNVSSTWLLELDETFIVGTTTVKCYPKDSKSALLHCEDTLYHLNLHDGITPWSLFRLFMGDEDAHSLSPDLVNVVAQVPSNLKYREAVEASTSWLCVQKQELFQMSVSFAAQPTVVPRHKHISGSPRHLLFSEHLQAFIVVFTRSLIDESQQRGIRRIEHYIQLYGPDGVKRHDPILIELKIGETISGVMEWFPQLETDSAKRHLLMIYTSISYGPDHAPSGRILVSQVDPQGPRQFKRAGAFDGAISSLTPYDPTSILYCEGESLGLLRMESDREGDRVRFSISKHFELASRGSHVSSEMRSDRRYIYVSTEQNSVQVLQDSRPKFSLLHSDPQLRVGLSHLKIPGMDLVLTASTNELRGLWTPPDVRVDGTAPLVFRALLPGSVRDLKLFRSDARSATVIAFGVDGAIYRFTIIDEAEFTARAALQRRFCHHDTSNGPRIGRSVRHIDLDLIARTMESPSAPGGDVTDQLHVQKLLVSYNVF